MNKNLNLLFAAIFMMGFLVFWQSFVMKRYNTAPKPVATEAASPSKVEHGSLSSKELTELAQAPNPAKESLTTIETPDAKVSLLSKGARVASWQVKERDHWVELVVPERKREVSPLETFADVNFQAEKKSDSQATFTATLPNGVIMKKTLTLFAQPPYHTLTVSFSNPTKQPVTTNVPLEFGNGVDKHTVGEPYDEKQGGAVLAEMRALGFSQRTKSWKAGFIFHRTIDLTDPDSFTWAGVDNSHFMMLALAPANQPFTNLAVVADRKHPARLAIPLTATLQPGETSAKTLRLYVGPKDYSDLKKLGESLDQAVDFGFFGVIAKALLRALIFFESLTGNYGWAIILLTFSIQLVVFPLTRKNLQHSVKMRALQPHLKKLQEQYKNDPKRLQVETFNFYKKNGMKFMGMEGCFPMLLQIPVFFAFYSTLRVAYELRGAPWIFWIHDLGQHDPLYVLPIIMGAGMFLQQKFTAVAADPAQARMMMFMPIMFVFMFFKLPSGLVLYWCVNSMTTILIQMLLGKKNKEQALQVHT